MKSHEPLSKQLPPLPLCFPKTRIPCALVPLCGSDGLADAGTALSRVETELLAANNLVGLLDNLLTLGQDQLDVAGVRHVRVDL